ncbi:hypothetical protein HJC23_003903 [Cyclotella cryptica]|uniref:B-related factor 1 n=1 Tax=Cyclotella cryptica TaxID=29204 RepID=A0ABD3PD48_9STRA|eukprot:CCRYP_015586-RA/>CCRYP_015586-RA protein AED:0.02 eAED:0.02 QI:46/1/1/1/1/1/2/396/627
MSRWNIDDNFWNDDTPQDDPHHSTQQHDHPNAFSSKGPLCPNCGSHSIESLGPSGSSVCTDCGIIVEENAIVSSIEFAEGAGGTSTMVGQFVGNNSRGLNRGGQYGFSRQSRENTLASGKRRIQDVAALLRLGNQFVDAAHRLFTVAVEKNFVQGRKRAHVVAACLYTACRQEKSQHMLIDFSDALQINVYTLGTCFLKFRRLLGLKLEIIDPALYIYRFAAHLNLDAKANQVAMTALRLVARMKRDWIVAGRRPAGICAAALLIASRAHGFDRQHHDVTKVLKVCGLTVMTRVREFEATPAASLTLQEFHEENEEQGGEEVDPPIFIKNRIREARAKAVVEKNYELLTSGALDNHNLKGKWASNWRRPKPKSELQSQYEEMYEELESEMMNDSTEQQYVDASAKEEIRDEFGINAAKEPLVSFTRAEEIVEHRAPEGISTLHAEIRYPLGCNHRPVILPNQATAEELKAPTQKPEDTLNFDEWKAGVPDNAADEVDFLFRSDDEVREREAVFNAQNKDYIETQQQKENDRLMAEVASRAKEEDEIAQEEGRRRYLKSSRSRKRKDGWDPNELTTEEALMEVVKKRKISRKINYDAMSALFDDSGDFSTELLSDGNSKKEEMVVAEA